MSYRDVAKAGDRYCPGGDGLPGAGGVGIKAAVVADFRDESTDIGMEAPGGVQEDAPLGRDGSVTREQVRERGIGGAWRMGPFGDLWELLRVAEQNQITRRAAHGDDIGQRHLARLVDE